MSEQHRVEFLEMNLTATVVSEIGGSVDSFDGEIVSMSPGSLGLRTNRSIHPDSPLQVTLTFTDPKGERHSESVRGWLVWLDEAPPFYLLGIIFPEINERENPNLVKYLSGMDQRGGVEEAIIRAPGGNQHCVADLPS